MKKLSFLMCMVLVAPLAVAQDFTSEVEYFQAAYGLEKKTIVENFLDLSGDSGTAFWEVYNAYETERQALGKERMATLKDYAEQYEDLSNEQADALMLRALKTRASTEKLLKKYYNKVKKATDAKTATQFIQLEAYLAAAITYSLMESIPFVGEY